MSHPAHAEGLVNIYKDVIQIMMSLFLHVHQSENRHKKFHEAHHEKNSKHQIQWHQLLFDILIFKVIHFKNNSIYPFQLLFPILY